MRITRCSRISASPVRALAAKPAFAVLVIVILALSLDAATAVFSVANAVLLRPLPFADAYRVVILGETSPSSDTRFVFPVTFDDWRTRQRGFRELAAFRYWESVSLEHPVWRITRFVQALKHEGVPL